MNHNLFLKLILMVFLVLALSGCSQVVGESNFTLDGGDSISGTLFILSQNASLAEGSSVDGSVIMLCCNLIIDGQVKGNVYLLTGNVRVDSYANINGDVNVLSGNVSK